MHVSSERLSVLLASETVRSGRTVKVCNVCLGSPDFTGSPQVNDGSDNKKYLFSSGWKDSTIDLCVGCLEFFQQGRWDKIAERAHDVLLLRLGVPGDRPE